MLKKYLEKITPGIRALPAGSSPKDYDVLLATWFHVGRLKPGSGTWGSLMALPVGYAIAYFTGIIGLVIAIIGITWIGIKTADSYGKKIGEVDHQGIVVDEVAGMWIAALPAEKNILFWIIAFIFFRVFDILKPWPASYFDKKKRGGTDVMMDDVVAGIYAFMGVAAIAVNFLL